MGNFFILRLKKAYSYSYYFCCNRPIQPKGELVPMELVNEIRFALCRIAGTKAITMSQISAEFWMSWAPKFKNIYTYEQKVKSILINFLHKSLLLL